MKNNATIIPCYAADTAGVCSALYELGGMTVVHDASGCNSTYATHDEPRWESLQSDIFISALTEIDAIMGNDEKLISDVTAAATDLQPRFITVCGSPMPMMTGVDFDAIASEIERRTGIRTFAMHTNGTRSYLDGASEALLAVTRAFAKPAPRDPKGVNILGATPLDLYTNGTAESVRSWLEKQGFSVKCCLAMSDRFEALSHLGEAAVNLVVSACGLPAAEYLREAYGIPYVCGIPVGVRFPVILAEALHKAAASGENAAPCMAHRGEGHTYCIGEPVYAGSLACELGAHLISPVTDDRRFLAPGDSAASSEEEIAEILRNAEHVYADPLYRFILPPEAVLHPLAHFAFSGRCYEHTIPNLICKEISL